MNIKKWFIDKLKASKPIANVEVAPKENVNTSSQIHHLTRRFVENTRFAISELDKLNDLLLSPSVDYIKGVHTKVTMAPIKGLGVIVIIFDSESGYSICVSLPTLLY